jgi:DNA-binding PadR family transcriptional regulator
MRPRQVVAMVKGNLEAVLLAYLMEQPRTGMELIEDLRRDFGVGLSMGRIYPLLHRLQKEGVLDSRRGPRLVVYRVSDRTAVRRRISSLVQFADMLERISHSR